MPSYMKLNIHGIDIVGIAIMILIISCLVWVLKNKYLESFIVTVNEFVVPESCPDYLVTDGSHYYLINSGKVFDGVKNPLKFPSHKSALAYLAQNNCPNLDLIDLVVKKNPKDVTVPYERECAKKTAVQIFDDDVCNHYMSKADAERFKIYNKNFLILKEKANQISGKIQSKRLQHITVSEAETKALDEINKKIDALKKEYAETTDRMDKNLSEYSDYNIEKCMMDDIHAENPDLKDDKFLVNFAKYFNNLNENIGQEYLYL